MEQQNSQNQKHGNSSSVPLTPSELDSLNKSVEEARAYAIAHGMDPNMLCND